MSAASKNRIYFQLLQTSQALKKRADKAALDAGGLTTAQSAALGIIIAGGTVSQAHIARVLSQRESAVATMAQRLQAAGYIARVRSDEDRRSWALTATEEGRTAAGKMREALGEINEILDRQLSGKEIDAFAEKLKKIQRAMNDEPPAKD